MQEFPGGFDFLSFFDAGVIAQHDGADFGFFKVERKPHRAFAKVNHLVEHRVRQSFNSGDSVANFPNHANILSRDRFFGAANLRFDFLQ